MHDGRIACKHQYIGDQDIVAKYHAQLTLNTAFAVELFEQACQALFHS